MIMTLNAIIILLFIDIINLWNLKSYRELNLAYWLIEHLYLVIYDKKMIKGKQHAKHQGKMHMSKTSKQKSQELQGNACIAYNFGEITQTTVRSVVKLWWCVFAINHVKKACWKFCYTTVSKAVFMIRNMEYYAKNRLTYLFNLYHRYEGTICKQLYQPPFDHCKLTHGNQRYKKEEKVGQSILHTWSSL